VISSEPMQMPGPFALNIWATCASPRDGDGAGTNPMYGQKAMKKSMTATGPAQQHSLCAFAFMFLLPFWRGACRF